MKKTTLIFSCVLSLFLLACGSSRNFNKQKYTNLKKINTSGENTSIEEETTFNYFESPNSEVVSFDEKALSEDAIITEVDEITVQPTEEIELQHQEIKDEVNAPEILFDDEEPAKEKPPKYERQRTFGWIWTGIFIASLATTIAMIFIAPEFYLLIILSLLGLTAGSLIAALVLFKKAEKGRQSRHINK